MDRKVVMSVNKGSIIIDPEKAAIEFHKEHGRDLDTWKITFRLMYEDGIKVEYDLDNPTEEQLLNLENAMLEAGGFEDKVNLFETSPVLH